MEIEKQRNQVSGPARWASILGGSAAVYWGVKRRSWFGYGVALAGGTLAARGVSGQVDLLEALGVKRAGSLPYGQGIKIRRSVTIDRPVEELYRFWRSLENLPTFMKHLESVLVIDATHSHWVAKGPAGRRIEWDAEIVADRPGEIIGWRSTAGDVDHAGSVRFEPATSGRGTVVRVQLQYNPPLGRLAATVAKLFGEEPEQQIREDLSRLKGLLEAGEIATTEGQPSGRARRGRRARPAGAHPIEAAPGVLETVEEASVESFPASDAPSWTAGGGR